MGCGTKSAGGARPSTSPMNAACAGNADDRTATDARPRSSKATTSEISHVVHDPQSARPITTWAQAAQISSTSAGGATRENVGFAKRLISTPAFDLRKNASTPSRNGLPPPLEMSRSATGPLIVPVRFASVGFAAAAAAVRGSTSAGRRVDVAPRGSATTGFVTGNERRYVAMPGLPTPKPAQTVVNLPASPPHTITLIDSRVSNFVIGATPTQRSTDKRGGAAAARSDEPVFIRTSVPRNGMASRVVSSNSASRNASRVAYAFFKVA
mmetsp:Transcript_27393/g.84520  ORF Transcript_27393/g.84520 Transcript_27393/m.84520 type:complete len:268 (-) Transcript_27393:961-1764(-)